MSEPPIPFNQIHLTGREVDYIAQAFNAGRLAGDGPFTERSQEWLRAQTGACRVLLTHSCTSALEMAAMLLDMEPGDEVIMPSFTFVSTANAFVLRGAVPVFVDVRTDTLNLDEAAIEAAISERTRVIVPVHYAGVGCEMDAILAIASRHGLRMVEDAAQGCMASYRQRPLGSIGDLGAYSFHETKNIVSGEGGCLLINDERMVARAEIIREKGTDRSRFLRGEVDKYTWREAGSSHLPSEPVAAFLAAQLESAESITGNRLESWSRYHRLLEPLESEGLLRRPVVPPHCRHNGHMYYVLLAPGTDRDAVLVELRHQGISATFHYVALHSSPGGMRYGRAVGGLPVTEQVAAQLVRLPLWVGIAEDQQIRVVERLRRAIRSTGGK